MIDEGSLASASAALRRGTAVVLPNPAPLTCVVAATSAAVVNMAKNRPAGQSVALWVTDDTAWARVSSILALGDRALGLARALLVEELLTLLVPVASCPPWAAPAVREGHMLLFGARWRPLRPVLDGIGDLHVSSANRSGQPPAASAAAARRMFADTVHVLDADDGTVPAGRSATTTVRLADDRTVVHVRAGAQDREHGGPDAYVAHLATTYGARRTLDVDR